MPARDDPGAAGVGSGPCRRVPRRRGRRCTVLRGRCLPYGDGTTFWPLVEIVKQAANISDSDSPQEARAKLEARLEPSNDAAGLADRLAQLAGLAPAEAAVDAPSFAVCRCSRPSHTSGPWSPSSMTFTGRRRRSWLSSRRSCRRWPTRRSSSSALARSEFVDMYPEGLLPPAAPGSSRLHSTRPSAIAWPRSCSARPASWRVSEPDRDRCRGQPLRRADGVDADRRRSADPH